MKKYFEFIDEKSSKFWEIEVVENKFTVRYGKIGASGQLQEKEFENHAAALKEALKLIAEKTKKGYIEKTAGSVEEETLFYDFEKIDGLDLNFNHSLSDDCNDVFPNFGVESIYSIGGTGHDHLVYCILPGVKKEDYPVAIFGEEEGVSEVIAASERTWFPSYLVFKVNELLSHYWSCEASNNLDSAKYTIKDLNNILEHKEELVDFCKCFKNENFTSILETIFETIATKAKDKWNYTEFYKIAENGSFITKYLELTQNNPTVDDLKKFILENKAFNNPIFQIFITDKKRRYINDELQLIHPEIALEVFRRRLNHDLGNSSDISRIIVNCAKSCQTIVDAKSPYKPLIDYIANSEKKSHSICFADEFCELGKRLKKASMFLEAATAFENAIYFNAGECEEFHLEAFKGLKNIAKKIGDKEYEKYVKIYAENVEDEDED